MVRMGREARKDEDRPDTVWDYISEVWYLLRALLRKQGGQ